MRIRSRGVWALALWGTGTVLSVGCLSDPNINGLSLECSGDPGAADLQCAERFGPGWRCVEEGCVVNEAPRITGFSVDDTEPSDGPFFVRSPTSVTIRAVGTDSDGDSVSFSWQATGSPAEDPRTGDPFEGSSLSLSIDDTPLALGTYSFRVTPNDGRTAGESQRVSVVVQSGDDVVFVSPLGEDVEGCGTIQRPCESLSRVVLETGGSARVQLASKATPYDYCIGRATSDATDGVPLEIQGCFDPESWEPLPELRSECVIECGAGEVPGEEPGTSIAPGHTLIGGTSLQDVTLAINTDGASPNLDLAISALVLPSVNSQTEGFDRIALRDIDVIAPACGAECTSVGVFASDVQLAFAGLNVRADADGFEPVQNYVGLIVERSGGQIVGDLADGTTFIPDATSERAELVGRLRGVITLNAPATLVAAALELTDFTGRVDGMTINGALGVTISGVVAVGGTPTVTNSLIDITGFGARSVTGIDGRDCSDTNDDCRVNDPTEPDGQIQLTATNNSLYLGGASETLSSAPCVGVGLQTEGESPDQRIGGNRIVLSEEFTLAAGAVFRLSATTDEEPAELEFNRNSVNIAGATNDPFCVLLNTEGDFPVTAGAIGVRVEGSTHATITDNLLLVGEQTEPDSPSDPTSDLFAVGLSLDDASDSDSRLMQVERNDVRMGAGVVESTAASIDASRIQLVNNLLYGGDAPRATGLGIAVGIGDLPANVSVSEHPVVRHNTIFGGGFAGTTASTRGVALSRQSLAQRTAIRRIGTFVGNLVDAGRGLSRRFIFENERFSAVPGAMAFDEASAPVRNYGQFSGSPARSQPLLPVVTFTEEFLSRPIVRWRTFGASGETLVFERPDTSGDEIDTLDLVRDDGVGVLGLAYDSQRISPDAVAVLVAGPRDFGIATVEDPVDSVAPTAFSFFSYGLDAALDAAGAAGVEVQDAAIRLVDGNIEVALVLESPVAGVSGLYIANADDNFLLNRSTGSSPQFVEVSSEQRMFELLETTPGAWSLDIDRAGGMENAPIPVLGLGASVERFEIIRDESVSFVDAPLHIAIVSDENFHIWLDVQNDATTLCAEAEPQCDSVADEIALCLNSKPSALTLIELSELDAEVRGSPELLVGCEDGNFEVWDIENPADASRVGGLQLTDFGAVPITGLAALASDRGSFEVMALLPDAEAVVVLDVVQGAITGSIDVSQGAVLERYSNTAIFDPVNGARVAALGDINTVSARTPTSLACAFNADQPLPADESLAEAMWIRDLRLTGGSCVDPEDLELDAIELDVDGVERDCLPDAGASEVAVVSGECL